MHVVRLGLTPVKGGRHHTLPSVELTSDGPVGDRVFALVDPATGRCLRTFQNPALLRASASWDGRVLAVEVDGRSYAGEPRPTGDVRTIDYWGREAEVEVVDGPWAAAYAGLLGREVLLVRCPPGAVVYAGAVTLVTSASVARLAQAVGSPVDATRFRATVELDADSGDLEAHAEDRWLGTRVRLGTAEVRVRDVVPRCAVVDHDPATGVRDLRLLDALASYRARAGALPFGIDAEVVVPGVVTTGDAAHLC